MTLSLPQLAGSSFLTHSRMTCAKKCKRKHHLQYNLGIRPKKIAKPLRMGAAFHIGIDCRAKGKTTDEAILAAVASYEELPHWANDDDKIFEWRVEREVVAVLLSGYFWYWERPEISNEIRPVRFIESEKGYVLPIRNPDTGGISRTFQFAGKRDQIVELGDGAIVVMENKTCGDSIEPGSEYWLRLRIDQQITGYVKAARAEGHAITDVLYNVVRKPTIEPKLIPLVDEAGFKIVLDASGQRVFNMKKSGEIGDPRQSADKEKGWVLQNRRETPQEFGERLRIDISERPEFYYARRRIPRLETDMAEFDYELWQQAQELGDARRLNRHYRNTSACLTMGRCEYLDICHQGIELTAIPDGFERVEDIHPELKEGDHE